MSKIAEYEAKYEKAINEGDWALSLKHFLHSKGAPGFLIWDKSRRDGPAECLFTPEETGRHDNAFQKDAIHMLVASVIISLPSEVSLSTLLRSSLEILLQISTTKCDIDLLWLYIHMHFNYRFSKLWQEELC